MYMFYPVQFPSVFRRKFICMFLHLWLVICYINSKDSTQLIRSCVFFFNFCHSTNYRNDSQKICDLLETDGKSASLCFLSDIV